MCEVSKYSVFNILTEDFDMSLVYAIWTNVDKQKYFALQKRQILSRQTGPYGLHIDSKYVDNFGMQVCIVLIFTNLMYYGQC
jgi:hypothetical protein